MAETTNLGLKTYDSPSTNENPVDIENNWNANWEIVDEAYGSLNKKKVEKEDGKGLSTNDFTNADKEKLNGLNNYDDAKIKEDISNMQEEQETQNTDISTLKKQKEALEKEVQNLREDNRLNSLTENNEGELVHINNSTGSRFNALTIEGNEKQDTRGGYNLFDILNATLQNQDKGVTIIKNQDGSITANGTPTADWIVFVRDYGIGSKLEDGQTYTLWQENYSEEDTGGIYIQIIANPNEGSTQTQKIYNASTVKKTFTVDKANYNYQLVIQIAQISKAGVFENYKNRYMIYKGTDDKEFELYGAMPSFSYPSKIKTVGDNINVFNDEAYKGFVVTQQNYNALEKIDLKLENNKYYVAKIYFEDGTSVAVNNSNFMLYAYKADGTQSANIPNGIAKTYANATKLVKAKIVANSTGLSTYANKVIKGIKIEEVADADGQPSSYSNYGQGCIELNIVNKNILDVPKNSTVTKAGMTITTDTDGVLTFNGTTTAAIYVGLNKNNLIMQAGSLFERSMFKKGNYNFSVDNLSSTQTLNASAYIRKNYNSGEITYLESVFSAKHRDKNFILEEDKEAVVYLWIASGITLNNAKLKFQIELDNATEIVSNKEQNYIIPVQQRMFSGDKFVKVDGQWKEMHTMGTVFSKDVSNIIVTNATASGSSFYMYNVNLGISNRKGGSYIRILSNYFKYGDSRWANKEGICGWENGQIFCIGTYNKNYDTADELKTFLTENNVEFDYELAKPLYLDCTPEQVEILDKIEQEAHTYSEVTNIYTEDEVGAIIKSNTAVDLKSVINNIQEQLIAE